MLKFFSPLKFVSAVLIFMGAACIVAGIFFYSSTSEFLNKGIVTEGTIVSITTRGSGDKKTHSVTVKYEVDGTVYKNELGSYNSKMKEGDTVRVRYMPDNPDKIRHARLELLPFWVLLGVGGGLLIAGLICLYFVLKKTFLLLRLKKHGRVINTAIDSVNVHTNITMNGRYAVSVNCIGLDGAVYKSEYTYLPEEFFEIGGSVDTYIDPYKDDKYYVDIKKYIKQKNKQPDLQPG